MPRAAAHSDSEEPVKNPKNTAQEEDDEEPEEEYEIEQVIDAKRGVFPDGQMGYLVKWKGYGQDENSWVVEADAENAKDLVETFWRKNPAKKRNIERKSLDKKTAEKPRKSTSVVPVVEESDAERKPKKRGRKSNASKAAESDDAAMEVDRPEPASKRKKVHATKKARTETPEAPEKLITNMDKYMTTSSWEGLIATVDTVEQAANNTLSVYFTLNTGESVVENSITCYKRFPQTMLMFFQSNLKWKTVDED